MSTPRNGGDAEDRPDQEQEQEQEQGRDASEPSPSGWEPPGWSLPSAEPDRPQWQVPRSTDPWDAPESAQSPDAPQSAQSWDAPESAQPWDVPQPDHRGAPAEQPEQPPRGFLASLFGRRPDRGAEAARPSRPTDTGAGGADPTDPHGTRAWAAAMGWSGTDGTGPEDQAINQLVQTAPTRPGKDARAGNVLRGRADGLDVVAFDVVSPSGRGWLATHAITAAPLLGQVPGIRLGPARIWRHGTGGLLQIPSGDPEFDTRWVLLAAEDGPQVRRLVDDPLVRQALLGSDDGDEIWTAVGFAAAIRPQANRPQLITHHVRLLAAVTAALAAGC